VGDVGERGLPGPDGNEVRIVVCNFLKSANFLGLFVRHIIPSLSTKFVFLCLSLALFLCLTFSDSCANDYSFF